MFSFLTRIPWMVMTGFAFFLFGITCIYWNFRPDVNFLLTKQDLVHQPVWRTVFYFHLAAGMLALVIGPFQFIKAIRNYSLKLHRTLGKIYVSSILFIGAPTGLYMAFYANGGTWSSLGFIVMSMLWFFTTMKALRTAMQGKIQEHINWMIRSYAVTFAAVSLRIWVPLLSLYFEMEHQFVIIITAWISWFFNLCFAEILIFSKNKFLHLKTIAS